MYILMFVVEISMGYILFGLLFHYNLITFPNEEYSKRVNLTIEPKPDSMLHHLKRHKRKISLTQKISGRRDILFPIDIRTEYRYNKNISSICG